MNIQESAILARLKQARIDKNLSGEAVAQKLGKSGNSFISRLESGESKLSIDIINKLCAIYEINSIVLFTSSEPKEIQGYGSIGFLDNLEYRSESKSLSEQSKQEIKKILPILRRIGKTMKRLKDAPRVLTDFYPQQADLLNPSSEQAAIQLGKKVALKLREHLKLGDDPIADISNLVWHSLKVPICGLNLENCWGIYSKDSIGNPLIIYSSTHGIKQRNIFTIAHELGHHLLSPEETFLDIDNNNQDMKEVLANAFAQELLVPSNSLKIYMEEEGLNLVSVEQRHIVELCQYFRVSHQMMLVVLRKNNLINQNKYLNLCNYSSQELKELGYTPEKYMVDNIDLSALLKSLIAKGIRKNKISYLFASEILDITESEVKAFV